MLCMVMYNILSGQTALRDVDRGNASAKMYLHCRDEHIIKWESHSLIIHEVLVYRLT